MPKGARHTGAALTMIDAAAKEHLATEQRACTMTPASAHITPMKTLDSRVDAIYAADPQLKFVGPGTISDVLIAADAAGITNAGPALDDQETL